MKKHKSQKDNLIAEFFFAVYPFSIAFSQSQQGRFILYFEKSLQILNKFEVQERSMSANKFVYFQQPEKIQSFRILSDRNLAYKWSLYLSKDKAAEEFLQSQDIDLSAFWSDLISRKENIKPYQICFKKMKCKLFYLVASGSHKQIHENIVKYFQISDQGSLGLERFARQKSGQFQFQSSIVQQSSAISVKKQKQGENSIGNAAEMLGSKTQRIQIKQENDSVAQTPLLKPFLAKTSSYFLGKEQEQLGSGPSFKSPSLLSKGSSSDKASELLPSHMRLNLTLEEVQISKQIENRIKQAELFSQDHTKSKELSVQRPPSVQEELLEKYRVGRMHRITSSQRLNEKGQIIITPFYYHFKYYLIILITLAIFITLIINNPHTPDGQPFKHPKTPSGKGDRIRKKVKGRGRDRK